MRRIAVLIAFLAVLLAATPSAQAEEFDGAILVTCDPGVTRQVDPVVSWGKPLSAHLHFFMGSTAVSESATLPQMLEGGTSCDIGTDRSMFWVPAIVKNGQTIVPGRSSYYLRAGNLGSPVHAFPLGFRWISGNPENTQAYAGAAVWSCAGQFTRTIPTNCNGSGIQMLQFLTSCWDGKHYGPGLGGSGGPANGRDHMASVVNTPDGQRCPPSHPVLLPGIQLVVNWPASAVGGRLSSDHEGAPAGSSQHADYISGWDLNSEHRSSIEQITSECLNVERVNNGTNAGAVTCSPNASTGRVTTTQYNGRHPAGVYVTD